MGFHRRTLSIEAIFSAAECSEEFYSFDRYMTGSDSYSFENDLSRILWEYYSSSEEDARWEFWMCILDFPGFLGDLNKCLLVLNHPENLPIHRESIDRYIELLRNKWGDDPYKIRVIKFLHGSAKSNN